LQPAGDTPWLVVKDSYFDEAADARFPFGGGAGDFADMAAFGAFQQAHQGAEEAAFAARKV